MSSFRPQLFIIALFLSFTQVLSSTDVSAQDIQTAVGSCSGKLGDVDIECDSRMSVTKLANGRSLINFTGKQLAGIGFAGPGFEMLETGDSVQWVDGVYINQNRNPADGQCSFRSKTPAFEVECRAILRDGRKLQASGSFQIQPQQNARVEPSSEKKADCPSILRLHGLLTRAQFQCSFRQYSQELMDAASDCDTKMGDEDSKNQIKEGMLNFDYNEKKIGHKAICKKILSEFPGQVRK